mmetsp:Transcript_47948/g.94613  ORF Transcript_47948/g.94613 Transcript_47948/m.94613 type:complete len:119 (+) Transcript_47948:189-545(+)
MQHVNSTESVLETCWDSPTPIPKARSPYEAAEALNATSRPRPLSNPQQASPFSRINKARQLYGTHVHASPVSPSSSLNRAQALASHLNKHTDRQETDVERQRMPPIDLHSNHKARRDK